ncbi:MAG: DUF1569 domain-containing protein [Ferruginibacter sp.]
MKKTLLDKQIAGEIIERAQQLQINSACVWGTMNVTEMLFHCNVCNRNILEGTSKYKKPGIKQQLLKFITFEFLSSFPKNLNGPVLNNTKGLIDKNEFEKQKQRFIETIKKFPLHEKPFMAIQPSLGSLNNKEWGMFAWMHMDHHLRQFNV